MENNIVQDFQNLRVFSNHNINRMDELVQDLSTALEESAKSCPRSTCTQENAISSGAVARRYHKRRRAARRATCNMYSGKRGTISEASESSVDEAIRDHLDNSVVTHSDSDDLSLAYPKQRLKVPVSEPVPPVESDSFTENLSPMRPQRRRRRFKHMAVDSLQTISQSGSGGEGCTKRCSTPTSMPSTSSASEQRRVIHYYHAHPGSSRSPGCMQSIIPGKRKRGSKSQREVKAMDQRCDRDKNGLDMDCMDMASLSQESSSLSSSEVDSDVYNNADEGREADDEQSDFFHETEECGVPEMIPWWDGDGIIDGSMSPGQEEFDQILSGALSLMSRTSQRNFRKRMDRFMAQTEGGREIRIGRRKLKGNIPRYTMMRFLQDQERWSSMQGTPPAGSHISPGASWNSGYSSQSGDYKRLRQTPPPPLDPSEEGPVRVEALPIPDSSLGNKMLLNMGWNPGTGLGPDGDRHQHQDPVIAYPRRSRKGLGYETQSDT
ncbi:G patch domain-containing protein 2-like [Babylonia areolata]|uniref:G patch domain-containing protein 2-like n=1 Tax=Babylonia areolata TaxID=304850 RepID=UPI003FD45FF9